MQELRPLEVTGARRIGLLIAALGLAIATIGAVAMVFGSSSSDVAIASGDSGPITAEQAIATTTTTTEPMITTTTMPSTTMPSTTMAQTMSTTVPGDPIIDFVDAFVTAIDADDVPFLAESLHLLVVEEFTAEVCETFIEREILTLTDYRRTGAVVGPVERTMLGARIANFYEVPVSFGFQGQTFDSLATFAIVDGRVLWFTECR